MDEKIFRGVVVRLIVFPVIFILVGGFFMKSRINLSAKLNQADQASRRIHVRGERVTEVASNIYDAYLAPIDPALKESFAEKTWERLFGDGSVSETENPVVTTSNPPNINMIEAGSNLEEAIAYMRSDLNLIEEVRKNELTSFNAGTFSTMMWTLVMLGLGITMLFYGVRDVRSLRIVQAAYEEHKKTQENENNLEAFDPEMER